MLCTDREDAQLHRAITSCLTQTVQDFELIIVTNGIQAEKLCTLLSEIYAGDSRVRIVYTVIRQLNFSLAFGLHLAQAPFVARMDSDDVSRPERLEKQLAFMADHPDVAVLGSDYDLIDEDGEPCGRVRVPRCDQKIRRALRFGNPICHPSVMLRRVPVLEVGGYRGGAHAEDYDLWVRLAETSWRFANLPEPLLGYNAHPGGAARRSRRAYANVAGTQLRQFLVTGNVAWLAGSVVTAGKALLRANRT